MITIHRVTIEIIMATTMVWTTLKPMTMLMEDPRLRIPTSLGGVGFGRRKPSAETQ